MDGEGPIQDGTGRGQDSWDGQEEVDKGRADARNIVSQLITLKTPLHLSYILDGLRMGDAGGAYNALKDYFTNLTQSSKNKQLRDFKIFRWKAKVWIWKRSWV